MKDGYSILLGVYIDAVDVDYDDCASFQIVCPECREPLFKGHRESIDSRSNIDYFSHYGAKLPEQRKCERRAKFYNPTDLEKHNSISRKQRLSDFLKVLQVTLLNDGSYLGDPSLCHIKMRKSEGLTAMYGLVKEIVNHQKNTKLIDDLIKDTENDLDKTKHKLNTTFSTHIQYQITRDMWRTLLTVPEEPNLIFLFRHAFHKVTSRWLPWINKPDSLDKQLALVILNSIEAIYNCKKKRKVNQLLAEIHSKTLPNSYGTISTVLNRILGNVLDQMGEALITMPYAEILNNKYGLANLDYPDSVVAANPLVRKMVAEDKKAQIDRYNRSHPPKTQSH